LDLVVSAVVEGPTDAVIVARIIQLAGLHVGTTYPQGGKHQLDRRLSAYNNAARFSYWLVVRDLNGDAACAPDLIQKILPAPSRFMKLRIAVRAAEAWLLADRQSIARFLAIPAARITTNPEGLTDPKRELVDLARGSRRRSIREDMVPQHGTTGRVGPGYPGRIIEFARDSWRPDVAARQSQSLARCISAVEQWAVNGTSRSR
jgi:hypothetical protein